MTSVSDRGTDEFIEQLLEVSLHLDDAICSNEPFVLHIKKRKHLL